MEEDIQNLSPTVMFRGTPCIWSIERNKLKVFLFVVEKVRREGGRITL